MNRIRRAGIAMAVWAVGIGAALAQQTLTVDWQSLAWPTGSLSQSFALGAGTVDFSFSGETSAFTADSPNLRLLPSGGQLESSLALEANFAPGGSQEITLTVDFNYPAGVENLSFTLFDVDSNISGNPQDGVTATAGNGAATFDPTNVTTSFANAFVPPGTVVGTSNSLNSTAQANAGFQFAQTGIRRLTLVYSYPGSASDPNTQIVSLHDLTFTVVSGSGNQPPVAVDDGASTTVGVAVDIPVLVNDSDPDDEPVLLIPPGGTTAQGGSVAVNTHGTPLDRSDDSIVYTPPGVFQGTDTFQYTVEDAEGATDTATVTVLVNPPGNQPPVAADDSAATMVGVAVDVPVLANDSDPDNEPVLLIPPGGTSAQGGAVSVNTNGTPLDRSDDSIVYTPPGVFQGTDTFQYTIEDADGATDTATVTVLVSPPDNQAPVAVDDSAATTGGIPVDIPVLANDFDPNAEPVLLIPPAGASSQGGSVAVNTHGTPLDRSDDSIVYTPPDGYLGIDTFSYTVEDAVGETDAATVTVSIGAGSGPVATDDSATTAVDTPVTIAVLANDSDARSDVFLIPPTGSSSQGGALARDVNGTPGDASDDRIVYDPPAGFSGTDTFGYTIRDVAGNTDSATVTVTVQDVTAPVAVDDEAVTGLEQTVSIPVLANDSDPGGGPVFLVAAPATSPQGGTIAIVGDALEYTPPAGFLGADVFAYSIEDASGNTASAQVTVSVLADSSVALTLTIDPGTTYPGGIVRVRAAMRNDGLMPVSDGELVVTLPAGFSVLAPPSAPGGTSVSFDGIDLGPTQSTTFSLVLAASAGLAAGEYTVGSAASVGGVAIGAPASSVLRVAGDPDFDLQTVFGRVYRDRDADGRQGEGEPGIPGVRLATATGLVVETDAHGLFHLAGIDAGPFERGRNLILKVDASTLPAGAEVTTGNPLVRRVTPGLPARFDFGVAFPDLAREPCCTIEEMELGRIHFTAESDAVWPEFQPVLAQLADRLRARGGGVLTLQGVSDEKLDRVVDTLRSLLGPGAIRVEDPGAGRPSGTCLPEHCEEEAGWTIEVTRNPFLPEPDRVDLGGRFAIRLPEGGSLWITEDPTAVEPRLAVLGPDQFSPGVPLVFHVYTNYARFIDSLELALYRGDDSDLAFPLERINVPVRPFGRVVWEGDPRGEESLQYVLRARDGKDRVDRTRAQVIQRSENPLPDERRGPITRPVESAAASPLGGRILELKPPTPVRSKVRETRSYLLRPELRADGALTDLARAEIDAAIVDLFYLEDLQLEVVGLADRSTTVAGHLRRVLDLPEDRVVVVAREGGDEAEVEVQAVGQTVRSRMVGVATAELVDPETGQSTPVQRGLAEGLRASRRRETEGAGPDVLSALWGANQLEQQGIPVHGSRVRIHGTEVPAGFDVRIDGRPVPVDAAGSFSAETLLPVGSHRVAVELGRDGGRGQRYELPVEVSGSDLFYVALADLTLADQEVEGSVEPLSGDERYEEDFLAEGRVAFYLKGKIRGKYLITAQLDTTEEQLEDLLANLGETRPDAVLRRLDPDAYYPVYGDDSTTFLDTNSQGRMYVRLEWNKSRAVWGNFHTGITGNEFAWYNRSLYGAQLLHRSLATRADGSPRTEANLFVADSETALGHSELLATGGSLYYLRHRNLLPGSEKARVEIRDRDSDRVVGNVTLTRGADYEVDEVAGRILLARPLQQVADQAQPSLIRDVPLDGNRVILIVDYEFVPDGLSDSEVAVGARGRHWIGDRVAIGGTAVREGRGSEDYGLYGGDLTVQARPGTYLKLEYASSEESQTEAYFSDNGGLSYTRRGSSARGREGAAWGAEGRFDLGPVLGEDNDWVAATWYRQTEAGFSVARRDPAVETTEYGFEVHGEVGERVDLAARAAIVERDADERRRYTVQASSRMGARGRLAAEVRQQDDVVAGVDTAATLGALRYEHRLSDVVSLRGTAQLTIDDDGGRYEENDLVSVGLTSRLGSRFRVGGEVATGDRGDAATATLDFRVDERHELYGTFTQSVDRATAGPARRFGLGQRSRISDQTTLFTENQFVISREGNGLTQVFGLDFIPRSGWSLSLSAQSGDLIAEAGPVERDAASFSAAYRAAAARIWTKLELRSDDGAESRDQWLLANRVDWKVSPALRVSVRLNASETEDDLDPAAGAELVESSVGLAVRPPSTDRFRMLARYTYLKDLPGPDQVRPGTDQQSNVLAVEGVVRLTGPLEAAAKVAVREGKIRPDRVAGEWLDSTATLGVLRLSRTFGRRWEALAEYRSLDAEASESLRSGFLVGVDRSLGEHFKLGLGYNFTDFSDDLTDLDYEHRGVFLNFVTKY